MEQELKAYILQTSAERGNPIRDLMPEDSFIDKGLLDSLSLLEFVVFIETRYGIKIPGEDIVPEHFESLAAVTAYLRKRFRPAEER